MPQYSIVVLAYNVEDYLPACLDSLKQQSFEDWEAIVVVDASPDDCAAIVRRYEIADSRFKAIIKDKNEGTHLARRSGTLATSGCWVTYLDGDDEFAPDALEMISDALEKEPCDLLRFGVVVEQAGATKEACEACEAYANRPLEPCSGQQSLHWTFDQDGGYKQDWRAWSNVVRGDIARQAFSTMTTNRLGRSQDSYEFFVMLSLVESQITRTDIRGYRYQYGRGVSGAQRLSVEKFVSYAEQFASVFGAMADYANGFTEYDMTSAAEGGRVKLTEMLFTDWRNRVVDEDKVEAACQSVAFLGADAVASELMRIVRDCAYENWVRQEPLADDSPVYEWYALACELAQTECSSERYRLFESSASGHLRDLVNLSKPRVGRGHLKALLAHLHR